MSFFIDGYCISRISKLDKVEIMNNKYNEINKMLGNADYIRNPNIDISSWQTIFTDLSSLDKYIQIEDASNGLFAIGVINKVLKDRIYFKSFDVNGCWDEELMGIKFSNITSVSWDNRYSNAWKKYLESK